MINSPRRAFASSGPDVQRKLDAVVEAFAAGYNHVLLPQATPDPAMLPHHLRGFAVEGAAMSSALVDLMTLSGGRGFRRLAAQHGDHYMHLIHVGAGWAYARLRLQPWTLIHGSQPLLRWLAWDGWGFHQAFFGARRVFVRQATERVARGELRAIRDQGAGRALWFYAGADPSRIAAVVAGFPPERRCDLWAGIGLAASYTGAQTPDSVADLARAAGEYQDHLAQGAAFAAKAHVLSGEVPGASASAIEILAGAKPAVAAAWTDECLAAVRGGSDGPAAYQEWRTGIRRAWARHKGGVLL